MNYTMVQVAGVHVLGRPGRVAFNSWIYALQLRVTMLQFDAINNEMLQLNDTGIEVKFYDGRQTFISSLTSSLQAQADLPHALGFLNCITSDACIGVSIIATVYAKFVMTGTALSESLNDEEVHPNFNRISITTSTLAEAGLSLLSFYGWRQMFLIYDNSALVSDLVNNFIVLAPSYNVDVLDYKLRISTEYIVQNGVSVLAALDSGDVRIVAVHVKYTVAQVVVPQLFPSGPLPGYQYVTWPETEAESAYAVKLGANVFGVRSADFLFSGTRDISEALSLVLSSHKDWYERNWQDIVRPYEWDPATDSIAPFPSDFWIYILASGSSSLMAYIDCTDAAEYLFLTLQQMVATDQLVTPRTVEQALRAGGSAFDGYTGRVALDKAGGSGGDLSIVQFLATNYTIAKNLDPNFFNQVYSTNYSRTGSVEVAPVMTYSSALKQVIVNPIQSPEFPDGITGTEFKKADQPFLVPTDLTYDSALLKCDSPNTRSLPITQSTFEVVTDSAVDIYNVDSSHNLSATLLPDVAYSWRCYVSTLAGASAWSAVVTGQASKAISCDIAGCGDLSTCPDSGDTCVCSFEYARPVEPIGVSRRCEEIFPPCSTSGGCLGVYGTCSAMTGVCECASGTELAALPGLTGVSALADAFSAAGSEASGSQYRLCVLSVASTDDTRKFWTISLWLSAWGLLASLWVIWEFVYNAQLKYPNTMMQAFVAFAAPDLVLSLLNFVIYLDSLVDGNPLGSVTGTGGRDDQGCLTVSFIMYTTVICTYFAPTVVALVTFLKFNAVSQGKASFALSSMVVFAITIIVPTVVGACLAGGALNTDADDKESVLGSYRGLYCYVRRWDDAMTGVVVIILFCISAGVTVLFYMLTTLKVAAIVKNASSAGAAKAPRALMKRGVMLTATFVCTWIWFITTGGLAYDEQTIEIDFDMVGAIIINAQPIVDAIILLTLPNVRLDYLSRWLKAVGGQVGSSSSSSSS